MTHDQGHRVSVDLSPELVRVLSILHSKKSAIYGNAWRKRGEVLSIFCNIARKYDRLEMAVVTGEFDRALDGSLDRSVEPIIDTLADLAIYALKYLTFLAEASPGAFPSPLNHAGFTDFATALHTMSRAPHSISGRIGSNPAATFVAVTTAMHDVETILLEAPTGAGQMKKVGAVTAIAAGTIALLTQLAASSPGLWITFTTEIDSL